MSLPKIDIDDVAKIIGYKEIRIFQLEQQLELVVAEVSKRDEQIQTLKTEAVGAAV